MALRLSRVVAHRQPTNRCTRRTALAACVAAVVLSGCSQHHGFDGIASTSVGSISRQANQSNLQIAKASFQRQAYGLAEKQFRLAVEDNRKDAEAWLGLAASYDQLKRFDLADRAYDELRALIGDNVVVFNNLGYSYTLRGNYAKAATMLARARRLSPEDEQVLKNIDFLNRRRAAAGQ
ncbi:MAG: tetratricopeptide repeat protein [Hyphomicrobiaceae bacterium]